jgi:hypothetical protein
MLRVTGTVPVFLTYTVWVVESPGRSDPQLIDVQFRVQSSSEKTHTFTVVNVPSDGIVCVDMMPAVTRVRNIPVVASAIIAPVDSFDGVILLFSPLAVLNRLSQVLINVIVYDNNTNTLPNREKPNSASSQSRTPNTCRTNPKHTSPNNQTQNSTECR